MGFCVLEEREGVGDVDVHRLQDAVGVVHSVVAALEGDGAVSLDPEGFDQAGRRVAPGENEKAPAVATQSQPPAPGQ